MARYVPRRKKVLTIDSAEFIISPLTYNELEEHGIRMAEWREGKPDLKKLTDKERKELRQHTLFGICCGLNNADDEITKARFALAHGQLTQEEYDSKVKPLEITEKDLEAYMDDQLAGKLWREIFEFTGISVPSEEEVKRAQEAGAPGEAQASS